MIARAPRRTGAALMMVPALALVTFVVVGGRELPAALAISFGIAVAVGDRIRVRIPADEIALIR